MTEADLFVALALLLAELSSRYTCAESAARSAFSTRARIADQEGQGAGGGRDGHDGGQRGC